MTLKQRSTRGLLTTTLIAASCAVPAPEVPTTAGQSTTEPSPGASASASAADVAPTASGPTCVYAASGTILTVAGIGDYDIPGLDNAGGDGGPATSARLDGPFKIAFDVDGSLYILEDADHGESSNPGRIRKVDADGRISTVVGPPTPGGVAAAGEAGGLALHAPWGMDFDRAGNIYVANNSDLEQVLRVDPSGDVTLYAGNGEGSAGDGGRATEAQFLVLRDFAIDAADSLFIADIDDHRVRRIEASGIVDAFAGTGLPGLAGDGGPATKAQLREPNGVALGPQGNVYIADSGNGRIRMVDRSGIISTVAGGGDATTDGAQATEQRLEYPFDVWVDEDGTFFIAEIRRHSIRKVDPAGVITTVAGTGAAAFSGDGGPATAAGLSSPSSMAVGPDGALYVVDYENARIRMICP